MLFKGKLSPLKAMQPYLLGSEQCWKLEEGRHPIPQHHTHTHTHTHTLHHRPDSVCSQHHHKGAASIRKRPPSTLTLVIKNSGSWMRQLGWLELLQEIPSRPGTSRGACELRWGQMEGKKNV